jgi:serine protease Do
MRLNLAIGTAMAIALLGTPGAFGQRAQTRSTQVITPSGGTYLGIGVRDIDSETAKKFNLKEVRGAEITSVSEDSPASKAGLKEGDVVLEYNGQPVEGRDQLTRMVRETPAGRQVRIGVWRNGGMQTIAATIEASKGPRVYTNDGSGWTAVMPEMPDMRNFRVPEMPDFQGFGQGLGQGFGMGSQSPMLGIMGESLGPQEQFAEFFGVKEGVLVKSVNRNSAAEKAGIKAGDVILKIDDTTIASSRDISAALRAARSKKAATVVVMRNKKEMTLTVTIDSANNLSGNPVRAGVVILPSTRVNFVVPRFVFLGNDRVI